METVNYIPDWAPVPDNKSNSDGTAGYKGNAFVIEGK